MVKNVPLLDSDYASEHESLMLDYLTGSGGIQNLLQNKPFSATDFMCLYVQVVNDLEIYQNAGRGKRMKLAILDSCF